MTKAAVVLSGCGVFDGSEVQEAVCVLVHLARLGATYECFAPDGPVTQVVDHATGTPTNEHRGMLAEAGRIARGKVRAITHLRERDFDTVIFPGGFGAAKNLSDFASAGAACGVRPDVEAVIRAFHAAGKPIGLCCIAPVLAARLIRGVSVTIGDDEGVETAIEKMGGRNVIVGVNEAHVDRANQIVTTPAYMYSRATAYEVFEGIGELVEGVLSLVAGPVASR